MRGRGIISLGRYSETHRSQKNELTPSITKGTAGDLGACPASGVSSLNRDDADGRTTPTSLGGAVQPRIRVQPMTEVGTAGGYADRAEFGRRRFCKRIQ